MVCLSLQTFTACLPQNLLIPLLNTFSQMFLKFLKDLWKMPVTGMFFLKLGFTPCKDEQLLRAMELQEKEAQKEYNMQEISLERANS